MSRETKASPTEGGQGSGVKLIEAANSPLGFFVLALLIVESFLAIALTRGDDSLHAPTALWMGAGLFVLVIVVVAGLVWSRPENLTFDKEAHLERNKAAYGTDLQTVTNRDALLPTQTDRTNGS